jgi:hypothetical protein
MELEGRGAGPPAPPPKYGPAYLKFSCFNFFTFLWTTYISNFKSISFPTYIYLLALCRKPPKYHQARWTDLNQKFRVASLSHLTTAYQISSIYTLTVLKILFAPNVLLRGHFFFFIVYYVPKL